MAELSEVKLSWGEAQHAVQDRAKWKDGVIALCLHTGDKEDQVGTVSNAALMKLARLMPSHIDFFFFQITEKQTIKKDSSFNVPH